MIQRYSLDDLSLIHRGDRFVDNTSRDDSGSIGRVALRPFFFKEV
jgi:hypothetical protein